MSLDNSSETTSPSRDGSNVMPGSILDSLDLHPCLRERIHHTVKSQPCKQDISFSKPPTSSKAIKPSSYILYMPTVTLRAKQNPAFALAVHLANHFQIPLIVLVVLTNHHFPGPEMKQEEFQNAVKTNPSISPPPSKITSRRLAFLLEALFPTMKIWKEKYKASVFLRIHNPPSHQLQDHLTLAVRAQAVVFDEPFVHPFLHLVKRVERAVFSSLSSSSSKSSSISASFARCGCFRVDGSTTVPPLATLILDKKNIINNSDLHNWTYKGLPAKAYLWQKKTEHKRMSHLLAAQQGYFDAPSALLVSLPFDHFHDESLFHREKIGTEAFDLELFLSQLPPTWRNSDLSAPDIRPWCFSEFQKVMLNANANANVIEQIKEWTCQWSGSDSTVLPCSQTLGTYTKGMERWNEWKHTRKGMSRYSSLRNKITLPHAPSRMSCFLNTGIISIFDLVMEVLMELKNTKINTMGAKKFEEEIVKWREFSYAHAFCHGEYYKHVRSVPQWARNWLQKGITEFTNTTTAGKWNDLPGLNQLITATTGDATWDAMQQYLINTGELHNNARMTWGKTIVHWARQGAPFICHTSAKPDDDKNIDTSSISVAGQVLSILCYLNDRFALDGASPPSYAGILWCLGWTDKPGPNGMISQKLASQYRVGPEGFHEAERLLMIESTSSSSSYPSTTATTSTSVSNGIVKYLGAKRKQHSLMDYDNVSNDEKKKKGTITSYFVISKQDKKT